MSTENIKKKNNGQQFFKTFLSLKANCRPSRKWKSTDFVVVAAAQMLKCENRQLNNTKQTKNIQIAFKIKARKFNENCDDHITIVDVCVCVCVLGRQMNDAWKMLKH